MSAIETRHEIIEMLFRIKNSASLQYFKNILSEIEREQVEVESELPKSVLESFERSEKDYSEGRYVSIDQFREERKKWMGELSKTYNR